MMPSSHPIREAYRASLRHALGPSETVVLADGLLALDAEGKIAACDDTAKLLPRLPKDCVIHDHRGSWIIPGFVDCHVHLPQLDCLGKKGLALLDWLSKYIYPMEARFADPKIAEEVAPRFYDALLSFGITTAAVYSTVHYEATDIAFRIAGDKGLRAIIGQVLMDQNAPEALLRRRSELLKESERLIVKWHGKNKKLFYAVTPRFALTCSKELLCDAGGLARDANVYFQTHLAETLQEVEQAKALHRFKNYAAFYEEKGCLGNRSLFAHNLYLEDSEWKILSEHHCCVAHCPTSNIFLKSGTMPLATVEHFGLRCGLGTDVGAGPTFSMKEVMDSACEVHPKSVMNEKKALYLATLGGAQALSMADQIGNFAEGKWADFVLFDNSQLKGTAREVFVAGQCVWKNS